MLLIGCTCVRGIKTNDWVLNRDEAFPQDALVCLWGTFSSVTIFLYGTCSSLNQHKPLLCALGTLLSPFALNSLFYVFFIYLICQHHHSNPLNTSWFSLFCRAMLMRLAHNFQLLRCSAYVWKISLPATQNTPLFGHGLERGTELMWFESHPSLISF